MKLAPLVAGVVAGSIVLTGCASRGSDSGSSGNLSAVPGFDPEEGKIRVGVISPFTGPVGHGGQTILQGTELYINRVNAAGGIAGEYEVELVPVDSKYDPQTALAAYNGMVDDVVMIGTSFGTAITHALLPQAAEDNMLVIPASDDAVWVRQPNTLPTRPTYETHYVNGLAYVTKEGRDDQQVCALLQDDPFGEAVERGVDHAVGELGLDFVEQVKVAATNSDFTPQISKLQSAGCEVVVFGMSGGATIPAMSSAAQLDFTPTWVSSSPGVAVDLEGTAIADYVDENWLVAAPGAQWGDESVPGMAQLVEDFEEYAPAGTAPEPGSYIPGYMYGMAIVQLLEAAVERGDLSHESLLEISHSDLTLDLGGLSPDFKYGPVDDRQPPTAATVFDVDTSVTGSLKTIEPNYDSPAAQSYEIE